ncbi:sensor histidine kinase [Flavobacterium sp. RHBU_24]|uniref:ATP-binding protein n=1 Tax=Flavobacterium sp. RHBU_24 TaxID=3391185 RepID=UPI00398546CC
MPATFYKYLLLLCCLCLVFGCRKKHEIQEAQSIIKQLEASDSLEPKQRVALLDSLYSNIKNLSNDSINRLLICKIGARYYNTGNNKKLGRIARHVYSMAEEYNDTLIMAHAHYFLGDFYDLENKPDSSLYHFLQAEKKYMAAHDTLSAGRSIQSTATILYYNGSYAETEVQAVKALKLFMKANDHELIYDSYMALGLALSDMKNYDKALEYFHLSLDQIEEMEKDKAYNVNLVSNLRATSYNNMGVMYEYKKEYATAISFYNKGLALTKVRRTYPHIYAMLVSNKAYAKVLTNDLSAPVKAKLFEAKAIRDSLHLKVGVISSQMHIGKYYLMKHDTLTGLRYIKEALAIAKAIKSETDVTSALSLLALCDRKNNRQYSKEYFKITDSLQQAERATRNKFARIAYETERIEQQNKLLSKRFNIVVAACAILLIFTTGLVIIIRLRAKNRELRHAGEQQMANEKIYTLLMQQEAEAEAAKINERNRLAMELHDGILNRIFTTRFNLSQLGVQDEEKKNRLVQELQDTHEEIRKLSHDLKESFLAENESFTTALKDLVEKQQQPNGPVFDLYIDKFISWGGVTPETRVAIFRIIQEASTNARKHAHATTCNIALMAQGETIKLRIWDDGKGFEAKAEKQGIGLKNIADRIKALGGSFTVSSEPGQGTVLEILV